MNGYKKVDILGTQATHNANYGELDIEEYKIYLSKADKDNDANKGIGGVSIMERGSGKYNNKCK